jgi:hypothetical protein
MLPICNTHFVPYNNIAAKPITTCFGEQKDDCRILHTLILNTVRLCFYSTIEVYKVTKLMNEMPRRINKLTPK